MNMRRTKSTFKGALWATLLLFSASGQTLKDHQSQFNDLSPTQQKQFIDYIKESTKLLREKRLFDAIHALEGARKLLPKNPSITHLRANIHVELREFNKAKDLYLEQYKTDPNNTSAAFNIGEMHFVQKEWKEALKYFKEAQDYSDRLHRGLAELTKFKIYVCNKQLGNTEYTEEIESTYDFSTDSPIFYYINFVKYNTTGDNAKATRWLQIASRIFNSQNVLLPWNDTIIEAGYMSRK